MAEDLKKQGLFIDESFVLRVLDQEIQDDTIQLKDENETFLEKLNEHRTLVLEICSKFERFANEIQNMKMIAINQQNSANSSAKQRSLEQQQIQMKIVEKSVDLDRMKTELQCLQRCESEIQEVFISTE